MENDLISRRAFLERMRRTARYFYVKFDIMEEPAVDAVEVVRCADCRYLKTCNRTIELIPRQAQIGYLRCVVHSCEYGERRADDEP